MHRRAIEPADVPAVRALIDELAARTGEEPVGERKLIGLAHRPRGHLVTDGGHIVGAALVVGSDGTWTFELATDDEGVARELVDAVVAEHPGEQVRAWSLRGRHRTVLERAGFTIERELHRLRLDLPAARSDGPEGLEVRGYRPGDEGAWVEVNARAFAGHPEQGGLTVDDFLERTELPWWEPDGLRLGFEDGRLVAFCWTKVHPDGTGEIYAIAVDPAVAGRGYGRAMLTEGLRYLHDEAGCDVAVLYVDAASEAAMGLYRKIGFVAEHVDLSFVN